MDITNIIGDLEDNLEILLTMGAIQLDQRVIRQTLESGSAGAFDRLKRIVHKVDSSQKRVLLESLVNMGDNYAKEGLQYAQELAGQIPDEVLLGVVRNAFSYSFRHNDPKLLKSAVNFTESIESRNARALQSKDNQNLGEAYYAFALNEQSPERLDIAIKRFEQGEKQGEKYANALLIRGFQRKDDMFEQGVKAYDFRTFDIQRTVELIEEFNREALDYKSTLRTAKFMVASDAATIFSSGIDKLNRAYEVSDNGEQREELFGLTLNLYKRKKDGKIVDLTTKLARELFATRSEEQKVTLVEQLFSMENGGLSELAADFVEEIGSKKNIFDDVFAYGVLLTDKGLYSRARALFERALAIDNSYVSLVKVGENVLKVDQQEARPYFERALEREARLSDYQATGDILLGKKIEDLATMFYEKSLGRKKSVKKYKDLGEHCLELGSETLAKRFISNAAESTDSFDQYVRVYGSLLQGASKSKTEEIFREGLKRFGAVGDYESALSYLEKHYGLTAAGKFASKLSGVSEEVEELCQTYVSRAKKVQKEAERQRKLSEELDAQRQSQESERKPLIREPVSVPPSFDEGKFQDYLYKKDNLIEGITYHEKNKDFYNGLITRYNTIIIKKENF